jgi:elongator complex protein 3
MTSKTTKKAPETKTETSLNRKAMIAKVISTLKTKKMDKNELARYKIKLCAEFEEKEIPTDIEIFLNAEDKDIAYLKKILQTKPTRTISGVSPVAIMTRPESCPHGKCTMCPGGVDSVFGTVPQSYTGHEPATMRAIRAGYDPYMQVFNRLEQYTAIGHIPDKAEIIIMGGTFPATEKEYQEEFVAYAFKALNDFSKLFFKGTKKTFDMAAFKRFFELPGKIGAKDRVESIKAKLSKLKGKTTLAKEHLRNGKSMIKCVGLTVETRPDWGLLEQGNEMLRLGVTRVEIGIQSVYDKALLSVKRGHTTQDNKKSISTLKDLGFKLNFHMMLGLPGVDREKDTLGMKKLFSDQDYRPDMLKIYPCMVMPGTKLEQEYKKGKFKPINTAEAADRIAEIKRTVPTYCRIMRVQRDIPTKNTVAGVDRTNLRQTVTKLCEERGIKCRCIRCREAGRAKKLGKAEIVISSYDSSGGKEYFISEEDKKNDAILGFCRMRFPSQQLRKEITKDSAIIRELHVYGASAQIGAKGEVQHKGLGKELLRKAEEIAKSQKKKKMLVISGVGVREYYKKIGYKLEGPYMSKRL